MKTKHESIFDINNTRIFCQICGNGSPIILLHGFFQSSAQWDPYLDELGREHRLIIPDLRGHGRSINPSNIFTHRQASLDIITLLDILEIKSCSAIGYSTGSMCLLHMATTQPERIKSMILFCPTPYFPDQARQFMQGMTYESAEPTYLEMLHMRHPAGEDQIRALFNQFQQFALDFDDMNFTPAKLSTIKAHTLIIHGDRDEFFPISLPVDMYQAIPQSSLWIVPNAGHANLLESINVGSESMDEFPKLALEFLRSNLRSTS